jgi:hypothetical protein
MEPRLSVAPDGEVFLNVNRDWVTLRDVADHLYVAYQFIEADEGYLCYIPADKEKDYDISNFRQFRFSKESRAMLGPIGLPGNGAKRRKLEFGESSKRCTP